MKYKILISYDGTHYVGWQSQPNGISIQETLEKALESFLGEKVVLIGASRTDSGVHALGQVAHFETEKECEARRFLYGINSLLPRDIRVKEISLVDASFHAQYMAKSKLYHYHLYLEKEDDPFTRFYHTHIPYPLNLSLLHEATKVFVGPNDFSAFANAGSSAKTFTRTIFRLDLIPEKGGFRFECEGDGFLYKMVRNIVGASLDVARGKISLDTLKEILSAKKRTLAPPPAPARGLFLVKINYKMTHPFSQNSSKEEIWE